MARLERNIRMYLRIMAYDTAELFLDGLEDYQKGPDYLAHVSGEKLMKENGARNEKLVPIEELGELGSSFTYNKKILTIDKRLIDIITRRGAYSNTQYHIQETYKLKEYFDSLLGYNLYNLFPEIKENL